MEIKEKEWLYASISVVVLAAAFYIVYRIVS